MTAKLAITGLHVNIGARVILNNVSMQVAGGHLIGLLGPNGSGKSTTLSAILGLVTPSKGKLMLDAHPIPWGDVALRQQTGVVFQSSTVDAMLSPMENLRLCAQLYNMPTDAANVTKTAKQLLQQLGLAERLNDAVKTFSGGMRRKVDLARALLTSPSILLLDEPTSGVDENACKVFWDEVQRRKREGMTVIVATHKNEEAERCDHVILMHQGCVMAEGAPDALTRAVAGDILTLTFQTQDVNNIVHQQRTRALIIERLNTTPWIEKGMISLKLPDAHLAIPRLLEWLGPHTVQSVSVRKPTLLDVLTQMVGVSKTHAGKETEDFVS